VTSDFLKEIVAYKKDLLKKKRSSLELLRTKLAKEKVSRYGVFRKAVSKPGGINLIAEIKKASPSQGIIRKDFDVAGIARVYAQHNAAALSVLTEDKFFMGKPDYIKKAGEESGLPVLMKDFFIDELQLFEAAFWGASAVLLIAAILTDEEITTLLKVAATLDLDCLLEIHDEEELRRALACGAQIIGINNRDLHTFAVDLKVAEKLVPGVPKDKTIVVESGIQTHREISHFQELGAHAVLIGETFMRSPDIGPKIEELMHGR
jgi:indole-3-glycerol phosphate synthase